MSDSTLTAREKDLMLKMERELSLKQLQIKSLLAITQAINENVSAAGLYNMYKTFMSWEMGVKKMMLYVKSNDGWRCAVTSNVSESEVDGISVQQLTEYSRLHTIKDSDASQLQLFDIIIPVFHKQTPIAYAVIGGIKEQDDIYNKIQFITTITNIIAVALENKRLFKRQLEQETLKREMELASRVQRMLIPSELPSSTTYQLDAIYMPHYNVGGDYFDIIKYSESKFAFCIADISGKGVAAALLMANFQANLQSLIYQYRDLQTFIIALNSNVFRLTQGDKYITLFVGEVDLKNKALKYINAGNYPPFLKMNGEISRLDKGCTVIGAFDKLPFIEMGEETLEKDGIILTFTDGLTDLQSPAGQYFEDDQIISVLTQSDGNTAKSFNADLLTAMNDFRVDEEFPDDIAVLTCKFEV